MSRPVVFVAWDSELKAVEQTFTGIRRRPDDVEVELLGGIGDLATGVLSARLEEAVTRGAAVLAVVDQPNANMAWELGMAMARGRPFALASEAAEIGRSWLDDTPLASVLRQPDICEHARELLRKLSDFAQAPRPPTRGERKLLLCPDRGTGRELHLALHEKLVPDGWELLDPRGWTLRELGTWLDEVGRLGWVQLRTRKGEHRHGVDNTLGALLAGYTHTLGVPVAVFVDEQCPRPLDARELERQHAGQPDDLVHAIRAWSQELDQPVQARSLALLDRYRAAVQARHASPLHYVRAFDLHVAELQPVEVEVVVGDQVDGLNCAPQRRAPGREDHRHGTLDRLLAEDLDRAGPVRWLLQAEPGAGKTTLLRRLAHQLALQGRLPVFVPLAAWEDKGSDPVELAVATELGKGQEDEARRITAAIRRAAPVRGRVWLLLDGFDEVFDHERVREQVQALAADPAWAEAVLVVTSRSAAVKGGTAWQGFTRASLRLLDLPRQQELVAGLLTGHPGRAEAFWRDVAARPGVGALLPDPFLLTLTVGLYLQGLVTGQGTPPNRLRLLQRAVEDCLARGWGEQRETTRPDRWSPRWARPVLSGLSLALHRQGGEAWEPDALSDALFELPGQVPQLRALFGPEGHWKSDRVFLDDIAHYGGLFGPLDGAGGAWRYLHRSFRELLAAECLAEELPADRRAEVVQALLDEQGEDRGAGRSAEVLALLAGMVPEDEAVGHLGRLAAVAPDAGIRALGSVEGLDPVRWLGLLLEMKPQVEGPDQWWPRWNNDDLDAVLDAIRRDGMDRVGRLWEAVGPELPAHRLGVLWYALERLEPAADLEDFLRAAGKADRERPKLPTCKVPAGRFWMGAADRDGQDQERPVHEVLLSQGFRMGSTPLTLAQTRAFDPAHAYGSWSDPQVPAVMLDWFTARLVAAWLGGRLPTEAEWEYACRAGTTAAYWSGDTQEDLARVGWYAGNSGRELRPVGQKPANPWGLHDMHGNTWEWCADRFGPFTAAAAADPASPTKGPYRVRRGGSGRYDSVGCRSATRSRNRPGSSNDDLGFRVVLPARSPAG